MNTHSAGPSSAPDVAAEANTLLTGFGILTVALFPIALPGLLLALLLALLAAPLALGAVAVLLVAGVLALPLRLARLARGRSRRRRAAGSPGNAARAAANARP
ncbi:MAG: hypothetical protein ACRDLY_17790 [Thermoleophilaceae bacterium]